MNREAIERMAIDVLGGDENAQRWLTSENVSLGGRRPAELAESGEAEDVVQVLQRIEHGVYS